MIQGDTVNLPPSAVYLIVAQTGALFYWGGKIYQMLKEHERRLTEGADTFREHDTRIRELETKKEGDA